MLRERHAVVTVELKNGVELRGTYPEMITNSWVSSLCTIDSVDPFLNVKLGNVEVVNKERYPHLVENNE